jgi:hypothetical protein
MKVKIILNIFIFFIISSIIKNDQISIANYTFNGQSFSSNLIKFNYYKINENLYNVMNISDDLSFDSYMSNSLVVKKEDYFIYLSKSNSNYTLNDGIYVDLEKHIGNNLPRHLQFSYYINNNNTKDYYEGCNFRLTNMTLNDLVNNTFRTNNSDTIFFRVRQNNSFALNDQSYFLNFTTYNYNYEYGFNEMDLFLDWDNLRVYFLHNKIQPDTTLDSTQMYTDFYHSNLNGSISTTNKVIFYNFNPNTNCVFKNFKVCKDFCDEESSLLYSILVNNASTLNIFKLIYILIIIIIL